MYIQLNSQVLYYEKAGEGPALLLLHGNGEDHTIFDALLPHLTPYFTVYLLDSRGCGLSSPSKEYHYMDMMEDVKNLINVLEIDTPSILGFSDGGIIALLLAIHHPNLVNMLIVCGANLNPLGLKFFARQIIKAEYLKTKSNMVKMMMKEPNITINDLKKIHAKTLVVAGEKDMIKEKETKTIASNIPDASLIIIPKADHGGYIIHSNRLAGEALKFLLD